MLFTTTEIPELADLKKNTDFSTDLKICDAKCCLGPIVLPNHASLVMGTEFIDNETVKVKRELESGWFQWSELKLPVSLTIQSGLNQPRYASLKGIMGVKKKTIDSYNFNDLQVDGKSQTELIKLFNPEKTKVTKFLEGTSDEVVEQLVEVLKNDVKVI